MGRSEKKMEGANSWRTTMKICYVTNRLPDYHKHWGGAEKACSLLADVLSKNKQEVTRVAKISDTGKKGIYEIRTLEDRFGKIARIKRLLTPVDKVAYRNFLRIFREIEPDIVHIHKFDDLSFAPFLAAKRLGLPIVFSIYDYWLFCPKMTVTKNDMSPCREFQGKRCIRCIKPKPYDFVNRIHYSKRKNKFDRFINMIDEFVVLSKSSADIVSSYGIPKNKINIVPIPLEKPIPGKVKIENNTIFFAGWLRENKGIHVVLEALGHVKKEIPNVKLYAFGTNPTKEYTKLIERIVEKNGLKNNVVFMGKKPFKEFIEYLKRSSVVVVAEQWENMSPLMIYDSMNYGKMIVAGKIGGIPEFVQNKKTGLLANPRDPEDFAKKIIYALKNKKESEKMGFNGKKYINEFFSEKRIYDELMKVYKKVI